MAIQHLGIYSTHLLITSRMLGANFSYIGVRFVHLISNRKLDPLILLPHLPIASVLGRRCQRPADYRPKILTDYPSLMAQISPDFERHRSPIRSSTERRSGNARRVPRHLASDVGGTTDTAMISAQTKYSAETNTTFFDTWFLVLVIYQA